jgi:hypothetical protein
MIAGTIAGKLKKSVVGRKVGIPLVLRVRGARIEGLIALIARSSYRCALRERGGKAVTPSPSRVVWSVPSALAFLLVLRTAPPPLLVVRMAPRRCGLAKLGRFTE